MMSVASAQLYLGGGMGQARLKLDCSDVVLCDKTDTGGKGYVGYQITPVLALEGTYFNFGKATRKGPGGSASLKSTAIGVGVAGRAEVYKRVTVVGRPGLVTVEAKGAVNAATLVGTSNSSTPQVYFGAAAEVALVKNVKGFAVAHFSKTELDGESGSVRLVTVGLQYGF
ncbi:outer membrane protein with beta-barrel domain [Aquabacterium commune]|uniref:Outer membrane protein with beta-barrel domain n=2 Tax=Burkholderiales genera incertae sedis TaxID=224471 RepID=A0A4R6R877_9BURK|nr:outer membrane protein with beta-barrel domain [Aquabacterium commune]